MERYQVVIVGGGLAAASVAYQLAGRVRVLLIEKGRALAGEAASQNAGMVRLLSQSEAERTLAIRSERWLVDNGMLVKTGAVIGLAAGQGMFQEAISHLGAEGIQVQEIRDPSVVAPALVGAPIESAWYLPTAGVADGHQLVTAWIGSAKERGLDVRLNATVEELVTTGGRVSGAIVDGVEIAADAVVVAAGAWSGRFMSKERQRPRLLPLSRHLLHCRDHRLSTSGHPWCWIDDVGLYAKPEGQGWLISPCDETLIHPDKDGSWGPVDRLTQAIAHDKIERYMPALSSVRFDGGWTGIRTFAPDRAPLLGPDHLISGLHWATGLGGFGLTASYAVGEYVATLVLGDPVTWLDHSLVSAGRVMP